MVAPFTVADTIVAETILALSDATEQYVLFSAKLASVI